MDIEINEISFKRVQGYRLTPKDEKFGGTVITFGGSEGSCLLNMGYQIAERGYHVLSLYYYGKPHLSRELDRVNLDFFNDVSEYIETNNMDMNPITIIGASRGAELALLLSTYYEEIANVVLFSPSAYMFSGVKQYAAWTLSNKQLPFITFSFRTRLKKILRRKTPEVDLFRTELKRNKNVPDAIIDVSNVHGSLLMFAGEKDQVWPSAEMGLKIKENAISAKSCELYTFKNAGHIFSTFYFGGGDIDGSSFAFYQSQLLMEKYMEKWHKKC